MSEYLSQWKPGVHEWQQIFVTHNNGRFTLSSAVEGDSTRYVSGHDTRAEADVAGEQLARHLWQNGFVYTDLYERERLEGWVPNPTLCEVAP